ncbi:MAG: YigZ family protein [bacterium]|nr:YigZ family protein [bacterium]
MHPDAYAILAARAEFEVKIKGSRFLAIAAPAADERIATVFRKDLLETYDDASHHCWALRIGHPDRVLERVVDDGEPAGSAGAPIGRALKSSGMSDLVCVVMRWFGGTKLGVGGLIKAYGQTARDCLATAARGERLHMVHLSGSFPYELEPQLRSLLARSQGRLIDSVYAEKVSWQLSLPISAVEAFKRTTADLSRGRSQFSIVDDGSPDQGTVRG